MIPGTMKDIPQADETKTPAMREPRMFPTEVCEFHTPMMKPRLQTHKHTEAVRTPGVMRHSEGKCFRTNGGRQVCEIVLNFIENTRNMAEV